MKLLLVDDEPSLLDTLQTALKKTNHIIETETNPKTALDRFIENSYDVVITDVRMPGMSGIELLKQIKARRAETYVIIMTAYGDLETATLAINNHAYAFFGKPVDIKDLISALDDIQRELQGDFRDKFEYEFLKDEHRRLKDTYTKLLEQIQNINTRRS